MGFFMTTKQEKTDATKSKTQGEGLIFPHGLANIRKKAEHTIRI